MKLKFLIITLAGFSLSTPAQADDSNRWYVSGAIGVTRTNDADFNESGISGDISLDNAVNFSGAIGLRLNDHVRTELELSYRKADLDTVSVGGVITVGAGGDLKTTSLLVNAYYDFMPEKKFNPYLSAGLGMARHSGSLNSLAGLSFTEISESDTVFAYQLGAGASFEITDNTALFSGYRYFGSSDPKFSTLEAEYDAHEIRAGIRYSF